VEAEVVGHPLECDNFLLPTAQEAVPRVQEGVEEVSVLELEPQPLDTLGGLDLAPLQLFLVPHDWEFLGKVCVTADKMGFAMVNRQIEDGKQCLQNPDCLLEFTGAGGADEYVVALDDCKHFSLVHSGKHVLDDVVLDQNVEEAGQFESLGGT